MATAVRTRLDPVTAYAGAVAGGKVESCALVKRAAGRHLADLRDGPARGLRFDAEAAARALRFFGFLRHSKGEWAGQPFTLLAWQEFVIGSLFGWQRADGFRRYRTAYVEVPRKNGKTTMMAGIGLYLIVADGEPGAEVFSAATKRDQARIAHSEAVRMVRQSPELRQRIAIFKDNLNLPGTASKYEPLGADTDGMDGLNIHGALIDELHAHKTRTLWDILRTSTGSRRQPLVLAITTAGVDRQSVCHEQREYSERVLSGSIEDDTYFTFISTIDESDDWMTEATWRKANPSYGVTVKPDDMARLCAEAKEMPSAQNGFLRLRLNVWTQQIDRWIDLSLWDGNNAHAVEEKALEGRRCYGGLDLASTQDMTAWVMAFPHGDDPETVDVLARFFCPEARLYDRENRYRDSYIAWQRQGLLVATPGDATDYSFVKAKILEDAGRFRIEALNVDRLFQGHQLAGELVDEGLEVLGMGQGFLSMAAPMNELHRRLLARKVHHGGNPILRWMADNVAVSTDPAGNWKPDKASSQSKIDGIVALVMALDRAMRGGEESGGWRML